LPCYLREQWPQAVARRWWLANQAVKELYAAAVVRMAARVPVALALTANVGRFPTCGRNCPFSRAGFLRSFARASAERGWRRQPLLGSTRRPKGLGAPEIRPAGMSMRRAARPTVLTSRFVLALLGLADTAYLTWEYVYPVGPLVCLGGGGCDAVRASSYAFIHGVPLPSIGLLMYAGLIPLLWASGRGPTLRYLPLILSGAGSAVSIYLTGIELWVLHAWCAWCMTSAVAVTAIFVLSMIDAAPWRARRNVA
jgi:uncharacterized membrane protein